MTASSAAATALGARGRRRVDRVHAARRAVLALGVLLDFLVGHLRHDVVLQVEARPLLALALLLLLALALVEHVVVAHLLDVAALGLALEVEQVARVRAFEHLVVADADDARRRAYSSCASYSSASSSSGTAGAAAGSATCGAGAAASAGAGSGAATGRPAARATARARPPAPRTRRARPRALVGAAAERAASAA